MARRNADWQSLVERLVFYQHIGGERYQIYDTDYLFVFGDLNYRTSKTEPKTLDKAQLQRYLDHNQHSEILAHDQLRMESSAGRTLHHLTEESIDFPPTYKYKKGSNKLVVSHKTLRVNWTLMMLQSFDKRVPSYCDRILHLPSEGQTITLYKSVSTVPVVSDMPVACSTSHNSYTIRILRTISQLLRITAYS